jgi:hypothetical protein
LDVGSNVPNRQPKNNTADVNATFTPLQDPTVPNPYRNRHRWPFWAPVWLGSASSVAATSARPPDRLYGHYRLIRYGVVPWGGPIVLCRKVSVLARQENLLARYHGASARTTPAGPMIPPAAMGKRNADISKLAICKVLHEAYLALKCSRAFLIADPDPIVVRPPQ